MESVELIRTIHKVCIAISVTAGIVMYSKWKQSIWRYFVFYLLFILIAELAGPLIASRVSHQANTNFYSFVVRPVTFLFLFWMFYRYDRSIQRKNTASLLLAVLYLLVSIADFFYFSNQKLWVHSVTFSFGSLLLLILIVRFYLHYVFHSGTPRGERNMMFGVAPALFIYYIGTFPFFAFRNTLAAEHRELFMGYWYVQMSLSCLMYLFFAYLFIWAKPKS